MPAQTASAPLLNDEFGRDFLGELVGLIDLPSQRIGDYAMMQHNNNPVRYISHLPTSVVGRPWTGEGLPLGESVGCHGEKQDVYTTTQGRLTLAEYKPRGPGGERARGRRDQRRLDRLEPRRSARRGAARPRPQGFGAAGRPQRPAVTRGGRGAACRRGRAMSDTPRPADIEALVEAFQASDCTELHLRIPGFELHLSADGVVQGDGGGAIASPTPPSASATSAAPTADAPATSPAPAVALDGMEVVRAPYLGVFYRAPKPGDPPYVEVGQTVQVETDVCLVEVMKLFTAVRAGVAGKIAQVLAQDGAMVEAGQPLFAIEPGA